jgi:cobalt-zinc-cadmium efflux system outer membrane protein
MMPKLATAFAAGLVALGGCAEAPPDHGLPELQKLASERLDGKGLRGAHDHGTAAKAVSELLENPLTVDSAVQIALLNNQRLQADFEALGISEADLAQAGLLKNPSVAAEFLFGAGPVNPSFNIVEDFFVLITRSARRNLASSALARATDDAASKVLALAAEVRAAYYQVIADEQAAALFRQVISATQAAAELAQRQAEAGNLSRRDQMLQQTQYAETVLEASRIEAQITIDREALNRLLGLWGDQVAWNLPDRLPDLPARRPSIDGLERLAVERRLDLAGVREDLQLATDAVALERQVRWLSVLGLGVRIERDPDSGRWLKGPSIELSPPIFDQGQARVAALDAERRRNERLLVALAVDLRSQVREAWTRVVAAQNAASFYKDTILPLRQQILDEDTRLSNGMLIGIYDLLRSRQNEINAAHGYIDAIKDYWVARAALGKALAGPPTRRLTQSRRLRPKTSGGDHGHSTQLSVNHGIVGCGGRPSFSRRHGARTRRSRGGRPTRHEASAVDDRPRPDGADRGPAGTR